MNTIMDLSLKIYYLLFTVTETYGKTGGGDNFCKYSSFW